MFEIEKRGITLYDYQKEAVRLFLKKGRVYLHFEMGMGKTLTALACALECKDIEDVLIIAPLSSHPSWLAEIERIKFDKRYQLMSYENFLRNFSESDIVDLKKLLVIFDEAHKLKNWRAKTSQKVYKLFRFAPYKLMLSGTMADKPWDVFSQFKILLPERLKMTWTQWINTYFILDNYNKPLSFKGGYNLDTLLQPFRDCILVKNRQLDVKLITKAVYLEDEEYYDFLKISDKEEEELYEAEYSLKHFVREFRKAQLQAKKFEMALSYLKKNPRTIIFVYFKETLDYYRRFLGSKAFYVSGDNKKDIYYILNRGDRPIITTFCLKEGINLQHYEVVIFHTLPLAYRDFVQAISRVYRQGQQKNVLVYFLYNVHSRIDKIVASILRQKKNVLSEIKKMGLDIKTKNK